MKQQDRCGSDDCRQASHTRLSRRRVVGGSGLAVLGWLSGSALGQRQGREAQRRGEGQSSRDRPQRMEDMRAFSERMRNAGSMEERMKIMEEMRVQERRRAIEEFKGRLGVSDQEWAVVKPRIEKVYDLVRPQAPMRTGAEPPKTEVEQRSGELRDLLRMDDAEAEQIKARLAALRAAKGREAQELAAARQSLRQIVTVRQEAELVLSGLLD